MKCITIYSMLFCVCFFISNSLKAQQLHHQMIGSQGGQTIIQTQSAADELIKFKKLLDEGIISEEEFAEQKKKLLST